MKQKIILSKDLSLPIDAVTSTPAFLGRKGSGKSYGAGKFSEQLLDAGCQVIILDPVGIHYGLRLDSTGKKPSKYEIPILGGIHGDIPLEPQSGSLVANFVAETGTSLILDVSQFMKNQRKQFVTDFAEQLFHRQKSRRTAMHLIIEEAQVFIPQRCGKDETRMVGAMEDIVRLGRNYGIGCSLISQRPQSVNKEVLNQCEPLVVFQLVGTHERKAVQEWVYHSGADVTDSLKRLPELKNGECYYWSPGNRQFVKTKFYAKITYDSSATPTFGVNTPQTGQLKPVDLDTLKSTMKDTIDRAKENDPKN